ncbi:MAG TPA: sigma-70 family RNA polymerase sigma factor [Bacillota bacterium]|jgi:RNA polymerase sporulation-specific sigma factor
MPGPSEPSLLDRAKSGDAGAREAFVRQNLGLVHCVVRRFCPRASPTEAEDVFQAGCLGLMKAIEGFEPSFGTQFSTYAVPTILGEIRRHLREGGPLKISRSVRDLTTRVRRVAAELMGKFGREPTVAEIGEALGENPEDIVAALESLNPVASLDAASTDREDDRTLGDKLSSPGAEDEEAFLDRVAVREALTRLPERQREIVYWRFFRDRSQQQVAALVGLSQAQVSRLERDAFRQMRQRLEA